MNLSSNSLELVYGIFVEFMISGDGKIFGYSYLDFFFRLIYLHNRKKFYRPIQCQNLYLIVGEPESRVDLI